MVVSGMVVRSVRIRDYFAGKRPRVEGLMARRISLLSDSSQKRSWLPVWKS